MRTYFCSKVLGMAQLLAFRKVTDRVRSFCAQDIKSSQTTMAIHQPKSECTTAPTTRCGKGKKELSDWLLRTVIGCMAIFRLPMSECDLGGSARAMHMQPLRWVGERRRRKGEGAREAKGQGLLGLSL